MNTKTILVAMHFALCCASGVCAATTYTYSPGVTEYGDDVTVSLDASGAIQKLAISNDADSPVFRGSDTMRFAADGHVEMPIRAGLALVISNDIAAASGFCVKNGDAPVIAWSGSAIPASTSANRTIVAENANVDDIEILSSNFTGSMSGTAYPYYVVRENGILEAQLEIFAADSSLVKCVKVRLEQRGNDIVASKVYARFTVKTSSGGARDFDQITERIASGTPTVDQYRENSYDMTQITLRSIGAPPTVVLAANAAAAGAATYSTTSGNPPNKDDWMLFAENQTLATMRPISAKMAGASLSTTPLDAHIRGWTCTDGASASVWVQHQAEGNPPGTIKGLKVAFRQNGADVEIRIDKPRYLSQASSEPYYTIDTDLETTYTGSGGIATSITGSGYCLAEFKAEFPAASPSRIVMLAPGCSAFAGGRVAASGSVALSVTNAAFGSGKVSLAACDGARIIMKRNDAFSQNPEILCNGGALEVCVGSAYIRKIGLNNGGEVRGLSFRAGNSSSASVYSGGQGAMSTIVPPVVLVGQASGACSVIFDVADGDGTAAADLMLAGGLVDFSSVSTRGRIDLVKIGEGTVAFSGAMSYGIVSPCRNIVSNGIWRLAADGIACSWQDYTLSGGTLAAAASTTNALGALAVEAASQVAIEADAQLAFANSSSVAWGDGATLSLTGTLGAFSLRFGTDANGLSESQIERIRFEGQRVTLDSQGWMRLAPKGLSVIVR